MKAIAFNLSAKRIGCWAAAPILVAGFAASSSFAADTDSIVLPQGAPHYKVGDSWTYLWTDELARQSKTITQTVTSVHADGSASLVLAPGGGRVALTSEANMGNRRARSSKGSSLQPRGANARRVAVH